MSTSVRRPWQPPARLVSDLSGRGNILYMLKQLAWRTAERRGAAKLLERIKQMEHEGYELEAAEGTFELLAREGCTRSRFFEVESYDVATRTAGAAASTHHRAVTLLVRDEAISETGMGHGPLTPAPVSAKVLAKLYPQIARCTSGLQGAGARFVQGTAATAGAHRVERSPEELVDGGRIGQRD